MPAQRMEAPISIREAVRAIQKRDYLLPAIQREFVWSAEKTETLFDSLMRGYPVGSFLFWKVAPESSQRYKFYEFMQDYHALSKKHLIPFEIAEPRQLTIVLDGQQRLTSLTIGLLGYRADKVKGMWGNNPAAYPKRRLYLNLAHRYESDEEIDREYDFRFQTDEDVSRPDESNFWFPVKEVLQFASPQGIDTAKLLSYIQGKKLNDFGGQTLLRLCEVIIKDPVIHYFQEDEQNLNRVLNIFIRLNSGGIPLSYSDLLLSIATAQWKSDARDAIYGLVDELNEFGEGFDFDKDFVLKSALVLTDRPDVGFNVENFDKQNTQAIEDNWEASVRDPLLRAAELAASFGYHGKTLTSANVLIPVAYYLKQIGSPANLSTHPSWAEDRKLLRKWLVVGLLKSVFSAKTDTLLTAVRTTLQGNPGGGFPFEHVEATLSGHGKSLKFSAEELDTLLQSEYGKRGTFSVLAAAYPALNAQFKFHLDHIFPRSSFNRRKLKALGLSDPEVENYLSIWNLLPNLELLEGVANQSKLDTPFEDWSKPLRKKPQEWAQYRTQHLIPELPSYELSRFKEFFEDRQALLLDKLKQELPCLETAEKTVMAPAYFAYGSNLVDREIRRDAPGARTIGPAYLRGYELVFAKHSTSRGCDAASIEQNSKGVVWGCLYQVSDADRDALRRRERGYREVDVEVCPGSPTEGVSDLVRAFTFVGEERCPRNCGPNPAYLTLIIDGSRSKGLPEEYVSSVQLTPVSKGR